MTTSIGMADQLHQNRQAGPLRDADDHLAEKSDLLRGLLAPASYQALRDGFSRTLTISDEDTCCDLEMSRLTR